MASDESIATGMPGRYASALFALAQDQRVTDEVATDLNGFVNLLVESEDLRRLVRSPAFTSGEQERALGQVLDRAGVNSLTSKFLKLLAAKRRLFAIEAMVKMYNALNDDAKGITRARVTVAERLSPDQWADLERNLSAMNGGKAVAMSVFIDPDLLGGLVVKLGSRMIDGSLKTKLNSLRSRMKEVG